MKRIWHWIQRKAARPLIQELLDEIKELQVENAALRNSNSDLLELIECQDDPILTSPRGHEPFCSHCGESAVGFGINAVGDTCTKCFTGVLLAPAGLIGELVAALGQVESSRLKNAIGTRESRGNAKKDWMCSGRRGN